MSFETRREAFSRHRGLPWFGLARRPSPELTAFKQAIR
jgi:hypothetical protein